MPVYKVCMKIIKHNIPALAVYIIVFIAISVLFAINTTSEENPEFSQSKIPIAIITNEESELIDGLKVYLEGVARFVELDDQNEAIQDALYFREVTYILRIPEGFTEKFLQGDYLKLGKTVIEDATNTFYIDLAVDQYLNTARLYVGTEVATDANSLSELVLSDLSNEITVTVMTEVRNGSINNFMMNYFNYLAYTLFAILVLGVSFTMFLLHDQDIKNRNASGPLKSSSITKQHILANLTFAFGTLGLFIVALFIMGVGDISVNLFLFILNAIIFTFCALAISFLIGTLVKSRAAIYAVSNVVALGLSFLSGVFVPQMFLSENILRVSSFLPVYWYVRVNNYIGNMTNFSFEYMKEALIGMGIQMAFAFMFISVALVISKRKWGKQSINYFKQVRVEN